MSHEVTLHQLILLSHELQSNNSSVSTTVVQITDRFDTIQTRAKVVIKPVLADLLMSVFSAL